MTPPPVASGRRSCRRASHASAAAGRPARRSPGCEVIMLHAHRQAGVPPCQGCAAPHDFDTSVVSEVGARQHCKVVQTERGMCVHRPGAIILVEQQYYVACSIAHGTFCAVYFTAATAHLDVLEPELRQRQVGVHGPAGVAPRALRAGGVAQSCPSACHHARLLIWCAVSLRV